MDCCLWIGAIVTLIASVGIYFFWYNRRNDGYWAKRGIKELPRSNIISFLLNLRKKPLHEIQVEQYRSHGRIAGTYAFGDHVLVLGDPEILRDILVKDFNVFHFRQDFKFGYNLLDYAVSVLKGEDWKRIRTIITPVFTTKRLKMTTNALNECSQSLIKEFKKAIENGNSTIEVKKMFGAFTLDVVAQSAFATKINAIANPENQFAENAKSFFQSFSITNFLLLRFLPNWGPFKSQLGLYKSGNFFRDVIVSVIKERKQKRKASSEYESVFCFEGDSDISDKMLSQLDEVRTRYNDMLQLFMDIVEDSSNEKDGTQNLEPIEDQEDQYGSIINKDLSHTIQQKKLTELEMIAQCVSFFTVGYETTALALSYAAYSLALNPECQEKLIQEIDSAFESHKEMNYDAVRDMKYLDCVISETLRMYPPATAAQRTAAEDYEIKDIGLKIEKGVVIDIPVYAMHFDTEFFPEPEKFKPERFLKRSHPQYAYLPFGAGPRNCLGMRFALMEIKMCLSNVLRHFRFRLAANTKVPMEYAIGSVFLTVNELPLKIEKRNDL